MSKYSSRTAVAAFAVLAFLFSYGLSFGFQWLNAIHPLPIGEGASGLVATALAVSGPALAAIVITWASGTSVRNWLRTDIEETRFAWWWLGLPLFTLAITFAAFTLSGAAIPGLTGQLPLLLGYFAFHILIVGLLEELGGAAGYSGDSSLFERRWRPL